MAGQRTRLSTEERRAELIEATLRALASREPERLSVQEISSAAGVSDGLLYHYFGSKDALVFAAMESAADRMIEDLLAVSGEGPLLHRLSAALVAYLDHVQLHSVGWRALLRASGSAGLAELAQRVDAASTELFLRTLDVDEPTETTMMVIAGWLAFERAACLHWLEGGQVDRAILEQVLVASFFSTLQVAATADPALAAGLARITEGNG
ncbi:putative Transcriptional regulator, TetR family [Rhodococcus sp. RD6.2]|uniref:TetR/AcrR family transcriptional regulator n=1 Tax=unclassified Rhodococcus (in: high G+C Gram-positive bacteria) TaxID=192944 RepID=UPI00063B7134|nr:MULTISPECIES: TetR/AcrR family transcriptional regulator [unclassified Rhodococcus (in: high G+C Gram-positive bacteria)]CRK51748.1 putative Transcriptional regulator, TetR family [Rhodococcus sp. RD6.2]